MKEMMISTEHKESRWENDHLKLSWRLSFRDEARFTMKMIKTENRLKQKNNKSENPEGDSKKNKGPMSERINHHRRKPSLSAIKARVRNNLEESISMQQNSSRSRTFRNGSKFEIPRDRWSGKNSLEHEAPNRTNPITKIKRTQKPKQVNKQKNQIPSAINASTKKQPGESHS